APAPSSARPPKRRSNRTSPSSWGRAASTPKSRRSVHERRPHLRAGDGQARGDVEEARIRQAVAGRGGPGGARRVALLPDLGTASRGGAQEDRGQGRGAASGVGAGSVAGADSSFSSIALSRWL